MIVKAPKKDITQSDGNEKPLKLSDKAESLPTDKNIQKNELYILDNEFNIHSFVALQTTSPTVEKENDVFSDEEDNVKILNETKVETEEIVNSDNSKAPIALSENELEFFAELIVEFLDWAFGKIMDMADRRYEKTSLSQKKRLVDAFVRVGVKYDIKLTPEVSLIVLILITYGVKGMKSSNKKEPKKRSLEDSNKVINKALHKDEEKTEKTKSDILKEVEPIKKGLLD